MDYMISSGTAEALAEFELARRRDRVRISRRILWSSGIAASVMLAVIPPLIDPKYIYIQIGIVIGLVGTCLGLLIEQLIKGDQVALELRVQLLSQGRDTTEALRQISSAAIAPRACRDYVDRMVDGWLRMDSHGRVGVFEEIRTAKTEELLSAINSLANGAVTVSIDGPYSLRARPFDEILSYRAIAMGPLAFWNSAFGQRYLDTQRSAVEHGTFIERIFILDAPDWITAEGIVRAQVNAGIECWVLLRTWVPEAHEQHVLDQGVITYGNNEKLLMQPIATRYRQKADQERLCVVAAEIASAEFSINVLRAYAVQIGVGTQWPTMAKAD